MKPSKGKTAFHMLSLMASRPIPKIAITKKAMKWMAALVDIHPLEIGWYGVVDLREDGSYLVRDILYPKHSKINGTECEISPEGEADMMQLLFDENREDDIAKAKLFWGHSHHNMATIPSAQDESQAMSIMKESQNICIRAICNKDGEMNISFFDYKNSCCFDHVPFTVENHNEEDASQERIDVVQAVMAGNATNQEKLKQINSAITGVLPSEKQETEEIRKWVTDLKKENAPEPEYQNRDVHTQYAGGGRRKNNTSHFIKNSKKQQSNMFPGVNKQKLLDPVNLSEFTHYPPEGEGTFEEGVEDVLKEFDLYRQNGRFD